MSATISLQTGTNVPRCASSLNSSKVVIFMRSVVASMEHLFAYRFSHHTWNGALSRPPFELTLRLRDEHRQSVERLAPGRTRITHQRRLAFAVGQVIQDRKSVV